MYLLLPEREDTVELIMLAVWSKVRERVNLVGDEVYLVPGAHLHQLQGKLPAVHGAQGVVRVTVEKRSDLLALLSLGEDGLLQQGSTERELLAVLLCEAGGQSEMFCSVSPSHLPDEPPPPRSSFSPSCRRRTERRPGPV